MIAYEICNGGPVVEWWSRVDVNDWVLLGKETQGSTPATWLLDPKTEISWLHKSTHIPTNGVEQGEDWAEVVSSRIAYALGVPAAETRLCTRNSQRGSISQKFVPESWAANEGHVVLVDVEAPGYIQHREGDPDPVDPQRPDVRRPGHSLGNIHFALTTLSRTPTEHQGYELTQYDFFAGYLLLDAIIANRDRHEQNWSVCFPPLTDPEPSLAPSYDHGGSLGYNLTDRSRGNMLDRDPLLETWCSKGTAHRFEHRGTPASLVDIAVSAHSLASSDGQQWIEAMLRQFDPLVVFDELKSGVIPEMSDVATTFAHTIVETNLRRLRDAFGTT